MSSRFNVLYRGEPMDVFGQIEDGPLQEDEARLVICNLLNQISNLNDRLRNLEEKIEQISGRVG